MDHRRRKVRYIMLAIAVLVLLFGLLIDFISDYLWFDEMGYVDVFFKKLFTQLKIGIPTFILVFLFSIGYFHFLRKGYIKKKKIAGFNNLKDLKIFSVGLSILFSGIITFASTSNLWFRLLQFSNSTKFNLKDPLFDNDISFYIFELDFVKSLAGIGMLFIISFLIITIIYTLLMMFDQRSVDDMDEEYPRPRGLAAILTNFFSGRGDLNRPFKSKERFDDSKFSDLLSSITTQLVVIGIMFFLLVGFNLFLKMYDLLYAHRGPFYGAGFTDVNITLWMYRILIPLSIVAAIMFVYGILKGKPKKIFLVPVIMIAVGLIGNLSGYLVQNFIVSPDEINKESKYLKRNIKYTQKAYNLDEVKVKPFKADNALKADEVSDSDKILSNVRINDFEPAKKFYNQTQSIRQYYDFGDVDVDRYNINGEYTQAFLSAREIDESKISSAWLNKHLKYTHGYGITLSRVDKITASGQPSMLIGGIPPKSDVKEIKIDRPEIYFGEETENYALVGTDEDEFDYPDGDKNKYARYKGKAGIPMNFFNRLVFALKERSLKLMVSTNISDKSKIIVNRNIMDRVHKILPYLEYDSDPYIVTDNGKLYWIIDAYTTSDKFPYSEPVEYEEEFNYIRNSIKIVVDAYNGDTDYYIVDKDDPMAKTYSKIYPELFKDFDDMPKGLKKHVRYPNMLFGVQADIYKRYHMNDVKVFYQNEDLWDISNEIYGTTETEMTPNYYILKLPGEKDVEFVNSIPYTPKDKKNMMGLFVARNDGDKYGELILYQLPKSKVTYGPMQIEAQIDQNTEISKEFSLWSTAGSTYTRGNIFVIPLGNSLVYVEPVYLEATNSSIPEVKRVIVSYNGKIAYEKTFSEALKSLFGEKASQGVGDEKTDQKGEEGKEPKVLNEDEIIKKANEAYEAASKAQKEGDWAEYGRKQQELGEYLKQLAEEDKKNEDSKDTKED